MFQLNNFYDNQNMTCIAQLGQYKVFEHARDLSVSPQGAEMAYFASTMNVRKRQVLVELNNTGCTVQAGAMQWMLGNVQMSSGIKGVGNFLGKMVGGAVTGESAVKPEYGGQGLLMLEPTYKHIILLDVGSWGGSIVLDDGLFLASDITLQHKVVSRKNLSSAVLGGEGLFNLSLNGQGIAVLESPVPQAELIQFNLQNDVVKIDGNMAIAWSSSLEFTVEKSGKSLIGSAASGEGFVNVYRGTGTILMAPTA
ncbi:MAG: AIM24 family protein [Lachnospiraceae bacterium]|nr:AIM24 family protein [Lachnospiraceae bacterium]